jgi:CheY-like chemotaxis protein
MRILIVEDNAERIKAFIDNYTSIAKLSLVLDTKDAIGTLEENDPFDVIFLDHDLGGETMVQSGKGTGYEVAQWLVDNPDKMAQFVILHSLNPTGRLNMLEVLTDAYGPDRIFDGPFAWTRCILNGE